MNIRTLTTIILTFYTIILLSLSTYTWLIVEREMIAGGILFGIIEIIAYIIFVIWISIVLNGVE